MSSKEEIYFDCLKKEMDEYAKQEIIAYEIWLESELNNDSSFNYGKTPEQLYELYKSQSK